jgi:ferredoxin-NADP reductase
MDATETTIAGLADVGPDTIALTLDTPAGFEARPGQFIKLLLEVNGETHSRFYTISSPNTQATVEITVGIDPDGEVTPRLDALAAGDVVRFEGPFGRAAYEGEPRCVVLAGGPGIGPAVGIGERALAEGGEAAIVYRDDAPAHTERLDALAADGAFVRVLEADEGLAGTVEAALTGDPGEQVFVYGFGDFLDSATEALTAAGGAPEAAKTENFG